MIGRLEGKLLLKQPPQLLLDVGGVGYELEAPLSSFASLPAVGERAVLHTHLVVREDAHLLFAFATLREKALFRELIKLNGVGPKLGLAILSGVSVDDFWNTVRAQDAARLTKIPGVGKKTAERLVLEMKDKAGAETVSGSAAASAMDATPLAEARSALVSLGYKPAEAQRLTDAAYKEGMTSEQVIREALKRAVR